MALELKQSLKLGQQLVMTPQLQQAIKLLQLSRMELENVITKEMLENPILEESEASAEEEAQEVATEGGEDVTAASVQEAEPALVDGKPREEFDWDNYIESYESGPSMGPNLAAVNPDEIPSFENIITKTQTLSDHLTWQLQLSSLDTKKRFCVEELIGNLNDDGYLQVSLEQLVTQHNIPLEQWEEALYKLQEFDPLGVGARSLKECLLLQAWALKLEDDVIEQIIENYLPELERKNYPAVAKGLNLTVDRVVEAVKIIHEMEPKPGRAFASQDTHYITPDVFVYKVGEDFVIVLNEDGIPRLRVSQFYKSVLKGGGRDQTKGTPGGMTKDYIQEKLRSALWLIKSIYQRQRTIFKVTEAIMKRQRGFLDHGVSGLKPMILRDIADDIGMHESTVSRVTTNKYVHTSQGVFELKFFFNAGLSRITGDGPDVAAESVRDKIRHFLGTENPKNPFSDQQIANFLKKDNIHIARRTVAKYREQLGFLSSAKRKRLF